VNVGAKTAQLQDVKKVQKDALTELAELRVRLALDTKTELPNPELGGNALSFGRPYDASTPIVFMHIPKTSGNALAFGLQEAIAPRRMIGGYDRVLFGGFHAFDSLAPDKRKLVYLDPTELPADADFVMGHIAFSTFQKRYKVANYVTVLREPLSRILSAWLFSRSLSRDQFTGWGEWTEYLLRQVTGSLEHFLSSPELASSVDNMSVRMLLWPHPLIPDIDFIDPRNDEALLHDSVETLWKFGFLDIIENPDMPKNLQGWLGRPVRYVPINETASVQLPLKRPLYKELTTKAIDLLEARARLDRRLWTLLANNRLGRMAAELLERRALLRSVSRHSWLMETSSGSTQSHPSEC
jgi:hypothetical protein